MWPVATTLDSTAENVAKMFLYILHPKPMLEERGKNKFLGGYGFSEEWGDHLQNLSCIHCTLLSFSLQTNKIQYKLRCAFTVRGSPGREQSI